MMSIFLPSALRMLRQVPPSNRIEKTVPRRK